MSVYAGTVLYPINQKSPVLAATVARRQGPGVLTFLSTNRIFAGCQINPRGGTMHRFSKHFLGTMAVLMMVGSATPAAADPAFRVRADLGAPLNSDQGWAAALNQPATVLADSPFRVRFELERKVLDPGATGIILQYRHNDEEDWVELGAFDFPYPKGEEPRTPRVSVVSTSSYSHGQPTEDLLPGSSAPFAGGTGINLAAQAPAWFEGEGGHFEFEWPIVVRLYTDGAVSNSDGDRFELRMADGHGEPLPGQRVATVQLKVLDGHLGGTFIETPGRIGPLRTSNGDLYFMMEPAESDNVFMMVKSTDNGRSWQEVDGAHRPVTDDLESVDARLVDGTIHIVHQITEDLVYHAFNTSDHPTAPDTWAVTDELAASEESVAQAASMVIRSDGSLVVFFVGDTLYYSVRSPQGQWSPAQLVDPLEARLLAGPQAVIDRNGVTHLAYYRADGTAWYRQMGNNGEFTNAQMIDSGIGQEEDAYGSVLPLVYLPGSNTVAIVYQKETGVLWERRASASGKLSAARRVSDRPVVREAADSQQPGADVVAAGERLHVLFSADDNRHLYHTHNTGDGWQASTLVLDDARVEWVRGASFQQADGSWIYRFVYDAGSGGGAGMNRYGELAIEGDSGVPET